MFINSVATINTMYWKIRALWKKYPNYFWGDQLDVRYYLCEQISKLKRKRILDIGCNIGIISGCADKTNAIIGIDTDRKSIAIAKSLNPHSTYLSKDFWKFKTNPVDAVLFVNMIEIFQREQRKKLIQHIASYLRKNGTLYLTTPNRNNPYYQKHPNKLTPEELLGHLTPHFKVEHVVFWNPISVHAGHLAFFPGAYTLMKWISLLFQSKKSVSIYIKARKR